MQPHSGDIGAPDAGSGSHELSQMMRRQMAAIRSLRDKVDDLERALTEGGAQAGANLRGHHQQQQQQQQLQQSHKSSSLERPSLQLWSSLSSSGGVTLHDIRAITDRLDDIIDLVSSTRGAPRVPPRGPGGVRGGPVFISGTVAARNVSFGGFDLSLLAMLRDEHVGRPILWEGLPFQPGTLGYMMDNIRPGSVVVDAGCNIGSYSVFFAAQTGPRGAVHCFEPQAKMAHMAGANAAVNGLSERMVVHRAALSFRDGDAQVSSVVPDGDAQGKDIREAEEEGTRVNYGGMRLGKGGESVAAVALDSLQLNNVSFIKIDVQGVEKLVLYGARDTIKRNLPVVAYEAQEAIFHITDEMVASLKIPKKVLDWDPEAFFRGLGYTALTPAYLEVLMVPKGWQKPQQQAEQRRRGWQGALPRSAMEEAWSKMAVGGAGAGAGAGRPLRGRGEGLERRRRLAQR